MKTTHVAAYPAIFNPIPDGGYEVSFPDFPGCVTFGSTFEETQDKATGVLTRTLRSGYHHIPSSFIY